MYIEVVRFTKIGEDLYNFGFGDVDPANGNICDIVVSNNSDGDKVLATVAGAITDRLFSAFVFSKADQIYRRLIALAFGSQHLPDLLKMYP
jgi:uncharacterized protein DUF6934